MLVDELVIRSIKGESKARMITISLTGGLGNQMFVYAAGLAAATRLATDLVIEKEGTSTARPYMLDRLSVPQDNVVEPQKIATSRLGRRLRRLLPNITPHYRERTFHFDPAFESIPDGTRLEGYFQSWRYGHSVHDVLRKQFGCSAPLSPTSAKTLLSISQTDPSVSLHVRRGDYLKPPYNAMHVALGPDYYARATSLVRRLLGSEPTFFVFSDDLEWAMANVVGGLRAAPVAGNQDRPWEDMALMSQCSHHIIANSSFSWWGAWLGEAKPSITVSPRQWFTADKMRLNNTCDLYPPSWYII